MSKCSVDSSALSPGGHTLKGSGTKVQLFHYLPGMHSQLNTHPPDMVVHTREEETGASPL